MGRRLVREEFGVVRGQRLIIRLIIQTIRLVPSGSVWPDEAVNVSRPDPSGADQIDAEHQATDLVVRIVDSQIPCHNPRLRSDLSLTAGSR
jgi:hypothetical protein